ncbi:lysozyme [Ascidiaceihabitans sp.]|uniref:lysozyme n=1 Tax=Ascidiaceihabitans sp. TaxID=1872644 RepID=UPI003297DDCF
MTQLEGTLELRDLEAKRLEADIVHKRAQLDIDERRLEQDKTYKKIALVPVVITALLAAVATLTVALIDARALLKAKGAETASAIELQKSIAELELERQSREHQHELIVQATKGEKPETASANLMLFVDVGALPDPDGRMRVRAAQSDSLETAPINDLKLSMVGLHELKKTLTLRLSQTLLSTGELTIGYDHWIRERLISLPNDTKLDLTVNEISVSQAEALLMYDLASVEYAINDLVRVRLTQNQFDVLVSFAINVGLERFERSTLLRFTNKGRLEEIPSELRKWVNLDNAENADLVERRETEAILWEKLD